MTKKTLFVLGLAFAAILALAQNRILIELTGQGGKGVIAIPDFRGSGDAARFMGTFNTTSMGRDRPIGPLPHGAEDLVSVAGSAAACRIFEAVRRRAPVASAPRSANSTGATADRHVSLRLGRPPVTANYLAFGYTAAQGGRLC